MSSRGRKSQKRIASHKILFTVQYAKKNTTHACLAAATVTTAAAGSGCACSCSQRRTCCQANAAMAAAVISHKHPCKKARKRGAGGEMQGVLPNEQQHPCQSDKRPRPGSNRVQQQANNLPAAPSHHPADEAARCQRPRHATPPPRRCPPASPRRPAAAGGCQLAEHTAGTIPTHPWPAWQCAPDMQHLTPATSCMQPAHTHPAGRAHLRGGVVATCGALPQGHPPVPRPPLWYPKATLLRYPPAGRCGTPRPPSAKPERWLQRARQTPAAA